VKMRLGYTSRESSVVSRRICKITGGQWSHVFAIFYGAGEPLYFESSWKRDKHTQKTGVRGPIPLSNVEDWQAESPDDHLFVTQPVAGFLPLSSGEVEGSFEIMDEAVHRVHYAKLQLAQNWISRRLGIFLHLGRGSVIEWTCSEAILRACIPPRLWVYFDLLNFGADDYAPSGTNGPSIFDATQSMIDGEDQP